MADKELPSCPYGATCYRKNPQHFLQYTHPPSVSQENKTLKRASSSMPAAAPEAKKSSAKEASPSPSTQNNSKLTQGATNLAPSEAAAKEMSPLHQVSLSEKCTKYRYYMTHVHRGIDSSYNQGSSLTLHNVINGTKGQLVDSCLFSYMYDLDWIRQQYKPADRTKPLTIVEGLQGNSRLDLLEQRGSHSNIKIIQAKFPIPYGVHHTKMAILRYDTGIRIMITTANLVPLDWFQKSQALWCSPLCPLGEGDSETNFKADLIEYLQAYKSTTLNEWINTISQYDMSKCKVFLIASVPGRHKGGQHSSFGHLKLRKVLHQHGPNAVADSWPVIAQFSSIGRLGTNSTKWLTGEFLNSLSTTRGSQSRNTPALKLVYPTIEDVRTSLEGYQAGASLPFTQQTYDSQRYIKSLMHKWRSDCRGRSKAAPHIKTYLRLSPDNSKIPWFLMTSKNLSKAAWGMSEKQDSQLMIRSYELGVLFIPEMFDLDTFTYDSTFSDDKAFPVPLDLPPVPYNTPDEMWVVDKSYTEKDSVGDCWN